MEDEDHYELDDSEVEAAMPPISLMQTARDILARPISQQELARAWDRSTHLPTEEGRVAACLDRLVSDSCAAFEAARETAVSAHRVQAPAQPASSPMPQSQSRTARKIIDLSMDDDDMPPVRKQIKRRRPSHDDEGRPEPSSIATGPGTSRTVNDGRAAKVRKDNKDAAVPQWLLDQFAAVSDQNLAAATVAYAPPRTQPLSTASQDTQVPAAPSVKAPFEEVPALIEEPSPLAQVLNIIPDVDTDHAQKLISRYSDNAATCVEQVIDALLADRTYPRAKPSESTTEKGKGTAPGEDDLLTKLKAYLDKDTRARMERIPTFTYRETACV